MLNTLQQSSPIRNDLISTLLGHLDEVDSQGPQGAFAQPRAQRACSSDLPGQVRIGTNPFTEKTASWTWRRSLLRREMLCLCDRSREGSGALLPPTLGWRGVPRAEILDDRDHLDEGCQGCALRHAALRSKVGHLGTVHTPAPNRDEGPVVRTINQHDDAKQRRNSAA